MIQSILFFALGFFSAGFLALLIAPAIWRRAVKMTRKRVEAAVPLSLDEIQADKDRIRAEFAMATRKLEMTVKSLREKSAAQSVEIGGGREELRLLALDLAAKNRVIADLESRNGDLSGRLGQREEELRLVTDSLAEAERANEERSKSLEELGVLYEEASFLGSSRQIELVARESEVEKLADDVARLEKQLTDAEKRLRETLLESNATKDALEAGEKKIGKLERKISGMLSTLADRDDKLERGEKAAARLSADRDRLESRLTILTRENKKLKTYPAAAGRVARDDSAGDALLREQLATLAAEVVNLTSKLEGPNSLIEKALAMPAANSGSGKSGEKITSLADRVRALRNA